MRGARWVRRSVLLFCCAAGPAAASQPARSHFVVLEGPCAVDALGGSSSSDARARVAARFRELEKEHSVFRPKLEAEGASVIGDLLRVANAFQVIVPDDAALARISRLPGVIAVEPAPRFEASLAEAIPALGIPSFWQLATPLTGSGMRIGIADTGIDYLHADFGGAGDPNAYKANDRKLIEAGTFPTARVLGGTDLAGDDYDASDPAKNVPSPDPDPLDCNHHGTHVASIAAGGGVTATGLAFSGSYAQSFDPATFQIPPGVAPQASLYAIKVFGCGQTKTDLVPQALEWAVDPDANGDVSDRLDVVNFSLGLAYGFASSTLTKAFDSYRKAGGMAVVAAGNAGDSFLSIDNLATIASTLSVAATTKPTKTKVARVTAPASLAGDYPTREGAFSPQLASVLELPVVVAVPPDACGALTNAAEANGKLLMVMRGSCALDQKALAAEGAGAQAVLVADTVQQDLPLVPGGSDGFKGKIPAFWLRRQLGEAIAAAPAGSVILKLDPSLSTNVPGDGITEFTGRGPTLSNALAPDLAAPGLDIFGASFGTGNKGLVLSGTSMATPFVSGVAALFRQARPSVDPATVAALLTNSAAPVRSLEQKPYSTGRAGAGRVDLAAALEKQVSARVVTPSLDRVGAMFERVIAAEPTTKTAQAVVKNHGTTGVTLNASAKLHYPWPGLGVDVAPAVLTLAAGAEQTVTLTLSVDPAMLGAPPPDDVTPKLTKDGLLRQYLTEASGLVTFADAAAGGKQTIVLPFDGIVRAAAHRSADAPAGCEAGDVSLPLGGTSATPSPVAGVFQSTTELGSIAGLATDLDSDSVTDPSKATLFVLLRTAGSVPGGSVFVDVNGDGGDDFSIRAARVPAFSQARDTDAYVTRVRDLAQQKDVPSSLRYVNEAEDGIHDDVFFNEAVVLAASFADLGITADQTVRLRSHPELPWTGKPSELTVRLPKARKAALEAGAKSLDLRLAPGVTSAELVVFHSTNAPGERFQFIPLEPAQLETGKLTVSVTAPSSVDANTSVEATVTVKNDSAQPRKGVKISGSVKGAATLGNISASAGSCTKQPLACDLGELAAGASVTLTLALDAADEGSINLDFTATSTRGCETNAGGNIDTASMDVTPTQPEPKPKASSAEDDGGCGCRTPRGGPGASAGWLGLALFLLRRRR